MRFKTSFFIDESIDNAIEARASQRGRPKSQVLQSDLELFYLCLDIGLDECRCELTNEQLKQIQRACSGLSDDKSKTNFILSGCLRNDINHETREVAKRLSKLSRLAILDASEVSRS